MKHEIFSDVGIFVCGRCRRLLKLEDLPCLCGNEDELNSFFLERRNEAILGLVSQRQKELIVAKRFQPSSRA